MKRLSLFLVATCAIVLATSLSVLAQPPGGGRPGGPGGPPGGMMTGGPGRSGGDSSLMLLNMEAIQKELELVDDQKTKIRAASEEVREELAKQMAALVRKKLQDILLPHQVERLQQIQIQLRGNSALNDTEVQEKLGLSADQKAQLTKLRENYGEQLRAMFSGGRDRDGAEDRRAQVERLRTEMTQAVEKILTAQQREAFEQMKGPKFEMPSGGFGGFRGRGGSERRDGDRGDRRDEDRRDGDRRRGDRPPQ